MYTLEQKRGKDIYGHRGNPGVMKRPDYSHSQSGIQQKRQKKTNSR